MPNRKLNIPSILPHAFFITGLLTVAYFFDPRPEFVKQFGPPDQYSSMKMVLLLLMAFYLNMLVLVPRFLTKKGWGHYLAAVLVSFILLMLLNVLVGNQTYVGGGRFGARPGGPPVFLFLLLVVTSISTSLRLNGDRVKSEQLRKERENESLKSELSFLRSQITPHFMFNVLNTLSSLARQKSDELEAVIIKISQLMRYMLYNRADNKIFLKNEVEFIESYIEIQKLRFGAQTGIKSHFEIDDPNIQLEPMLLIPFIENAFKHGFGTVADPLIDLQLSCKNGNLFFSLKNRFNPEILPDKSASGIGIHNVQKRLTYLYEDNHTLNTSVEKDIFTVSLKINYDD